MEFAVLSDCMQANLKRSTLFKLWNIFSFLVDYNPMKKWLANVFLVSLAFSVVGIASHMDEHDMRVFTCNGDGAKVVLTRYLLDNADEIDIEVNGLSKTHIQRAIVLRNNSQLIINASTRELGKISLVISEPTTQFTPDYRGIIDDYETTHAMLFSTKGSTQKNFSLTCQLVDYTKQFFIQLYKITD